ncbi:MAG: hypothetical protein ACE366_31260 [Bradymonadia bacterium]
MRLDPHSLDALGVTLHNRVIFERSLNFAMDAINDTVGSALHLRRGADTTTRIRGGSSSNTWTRRSYEGLSNTIVVQFESGDLLSEGSGGQALLKIADCEIRRVLVRLNADTLSASSAPIDEDRMRHLLLHEMTHATGLRHPHEYSILNYSSQIDARFEMRDGEWVPVLLPDDRGGLRYLYPAAGEETDVAIHVTTVGEERHGDGRYDAYFTQDTCHPSIDAGYSVPELSILAPLCGDPTWTHDDLMGGPSALARGDFKVCPGDEVDMGLMLANHGTGRTRVKLSTWFSQSLEMNLEALLEGHTFTSANVSPSILQLSADDDSRGREGSVALMFRVTVPNLAPGSYHIFATASTHLDDGPPEHELDNNHRRVTGRYPLIVGDVRTCGPGWVPGTIGGGL